MRVWSKLDSNLTMFNTAILYEFEWSSVRALEFMRRPYRPGASKRVQLFFPVYKDTLEESALGFCVGTRCWLRSLLMVITSAVRWLKK